MKNKVTVSSLLAKKEKSEKITSLTAYDFFTASMLDKAEIDIILVGDSLSQVVLGYDNTLKVTMDDMLHHTKAVVRGVKRSLVVADMPFLSCSTTTAQAVLNAGRFIQEAGADAVKVEGGVKMADRIYAISSAGIPVVGHIGLMPQNVLQMGGYKVQGRDKVAADMILADAKAVEESGAFAVVLECIPADLAKTVTETLTIPTIGIGAGVSCDGQVLVSNDVLGLGNNVSPKFVKQYADLGKQMLSAFEDFKKDVDSGTYPDEQHSYS